MKFIISLFSCIILINFVATGKVRYDNYKVYKVHFTTEEQFQYLYDLKINSTDIDFWQLSRAQKYADIMVGPQKLSNFLEDLENHGLTYEVMIENVQETINTNN